MKDEVALLAIVTLLGVLLQGELATVWEVGGPQTLKPTFCPLSPGEIPEGLGPGEGKGEVPSPDSGALGLLTPPTLSLEAGMLQG